MKLNLTRIDDVINSNTDMVFEVRGVDSQSRDHVMMFVGAESEMYCWTTLRGREKPVHSRLWQQTAGFLCSREVCQNDWQPAFSAFQSSNSRRASASAADLIAHSLHCGTGTCWDLGALASVQRCLVTAAVFLWRRTDNSWLTVGNRDNFTQRISSWLNETKG